MSNGSSSGNAVFVTVVVLLFVILLIALGYKLWQMRASLGFTMPKFNLSLPQIPSLSVSAAAAAPSAKMGMAAGGKGELSSVSPMEYYGGAQQPMSDWENPYTAYGGSYPQMSQPSQMRELPQQQPQHPHLHYHPESMPMMPASTIGGSDSLDFGAMPHMQTYVREHPDAPIY